MLLEDILRLLVGTKNYITNYNNEDAFLPERRQFVSRIALGIAAIPFLSLIYGMTVGKYNFKVIRQTLFFPDLPDAFDGFQITQISDVHSGSFDNPEKIEYAIDLINQQNSDLILFTGDIVNTHAKEMHPWLETFNKVQNHEFGKFSILGNHDYGECVEWSSEKDKEKNFEGVITKKKRLVEFTPTLVDGPNKEDVLDDKVYHGLVAIGSNISKTIQDGMLKSYIYYLKQQNFTVEKEVEINDPLLFLKQGISGTKDKLDFFMKEAHSDGDYRNLFSINKKMFLVRAKLEHSDYTEIIDLFYHDGRRSWRN